ncbi:MAG: hypothetical protein ACE5OO_08525 [Candidatus Bathyarchaeia archaeon]
MSFEGRFNEKVDVIDLIISVLKDHEKTLDELVSRLERLQPNLATIASAAKEAPSRGPIVSAVLRRWAEFKDRCSGASLAAFDIEGKQFKVSAFKDGILYLYQEEMPDMEIRYREREERVVIDVIDVSSAGLVPTALRGRLRCGLEVSAKGVEVKLPDGGTVYKVVYDLDAEEARSWLAEQLKIERSAILQGELRV